MTSSPFPEVWYPNLQVALCSLCLCSCCFFSAPPHLLLLQFSQESPPLDTFFWLSKPIRSSLPHLRYRTALSGPGYPHPLRIWIGLTQVLLPRSSDWKCVPCPRFLWIGVLKVTTVSISSLAQTVLFSICCSYFGTSALTSTQYGLRPFLFNHSLRGNSKLDSVMSSKMFIEGLWVTGSAFKSKTLKIEITF